MKSNNRSLYIQWFLIAVFITSVCVGFGLYFTNFLAQREERNRRELWKEGQQGRVFGPLKERIEIMQALVARKKMTAEEAFKLVDRAHEARFPEGVYLLDENKKVLDSHFSESFDPNRDKKYQDFRIGPNRIFRVYMSPHQPPFRWGGRRPRPPGLHPDTLFVVTLTVGVSIIIGIGLSVVILTYYLRKKARHVEEVMEKIKAGDLGARFDIGHTDETGLLMVKFNDMADEIEKLVNNLKNTEESRKKMLQELAHDLRTPVASMKSLQETLFQNGHLLGQENKEQFQNLAMKEVSYFERLVEDLLFLSGVNDPRYGQSMREINLTELVQEEIEFFDLNHIQVNFSSNGPVLMNGDEHLLRRLLKNALSNATRYAKKEVKVNLKKIKNQIELSVQDDGPGLREEDLRTFGEKKYSRQIDNTSSDYISIGLGSVIMTKITSLHNGHLSIQNSHPGAKLSITFPP